MSTEPILLIGGKGGSVSEGIYKCLRMAGYADITLLEYSRHAALFYRIKERVVPKTTPDSGHEYVKELIDVCLSRGLKVIVPGATWEASVIAQYASEFHSNGITCLTNNYDVIAVCSNKWKTYELLSSYGVGVPRTFKVEQDARALLERGLSIIVKPESGRGSQNIYRAANMEQLSAITGYFKVMRIPYILQELIADDEHEYTVGVVSDRTGRSTRSIAMQRFLWGGATGYARVIEHGYINEFCENIATKLGSTGPLNVQLRLDEGERPLVIEINPRFSGSAPMRALAGFNEPDMILKNYFRGEEISSGPIGVGNEYYRVFQEILIRPNSVDGEVTSFL